MLLSSSVTSNSGTPRTVAHQASLSVEFSRQEYWSGLSFPSPGDLPDPGIESKSLASPSLTGRWCSSKKKKKKKIHLPMQEMQEEAASPFIPHFTWSMHAIHTPLNPSASPLPPHLKTLLWPFRFRILCQLIIWSGHSRWLSWWEESRWRRNRMGRSLSLLQIHWKNNRTVNRVYKTTSDR